MRIKTILSRNRRDFWADMVCEHCGNIESNVSCYDDAFFHEDVIPKMVCKICGKIAKNYTPIKPKYPEGMSI